MLLDTGRCRVLRGGSRSRRGLKTVEGVRTVHVEWRERGGPPVRTPEQEGFGSTLLRRVVPMQTKAEVEVEFDPEGLRCRIEAPLVEKRFVPEY